MFICREKKLNSRISDLNNAFIMFPYLKKTNRAKIIISVINLLVQAFY